MSIKFFKGYWTIFSGTQPIVSFSSLKALHEALS